MPINAQQLLKTVRAAEPPGELSPLVEAMWWQAHGDWEHAHRIAQEITSRDAAWVHAFLHRVEGDQPNARYWYRQAARPECHLSLEDEWMSLAGTLLEAADQKP